MPLQFEADNLTSPTVWLTVAAMTSGTVLDARSGNVERVETQSSG